jgi:hypothetical protein
VGTHPLNRPMKDHHHHRQRRRSRTKHRSQQGSRPRINTEGRATWRVTVHDYAAARRPSAMAYRFAASLPAITGNQIFA